MNNIPKPLYERLTERAKAVFQQAVDIAFTMHHAEVRDEHLLYGIVNQKGSIVATILDQYDISIEFVLGVLNQNPVIEELDTKQYPSFSVQLQETLQKACSIASHYHHRHVGLEHLSFAILHHKDTSVSMMIQQLEMKLPVVRQHLLAFLGNAGQVGDMARLFEALGPLPSVQQLASELQDQDVESSGQQRSGSSSRSPERRSLPSPSRKSKDENPLGQFAENISDLARSGLLDPVIGRDAELQRVITILGRKTKHNPILVGEPGVGKTAIVYGLAQLIARGHVPERLLGAEVYALDLSAIIAGTSFRGEFEARMKDILDVVQAQPNIILFIDEIHTIVGAGSAAGSMDAANILKPVLTNGALQCIGATTFEEYKKYFEKDAALERRFQPVQVVEPTAQQTLRVLSGLKKHYEDFHGLVISDEALQCAVDSSVRYIPDRFLPDKALDLIDEAASRKVGGTVAPRIAQDMHRAEQQLERLLLAKHEAIENEQYNEALDHKRQSEKLRDRLKSLSLQKDTSTPSNIETLSAEDVLDVVSLMTGIPVSSLRSHEARDLLRLESQLQKSIIGQDDAIAAIARVVRRHRVGVGSPHRPIGSFMFLGPTGVGKTELAKVLARELFHDESALIKIDMSEFGERHTVSRLLGAPAGYVGYDEGGTLTERVRRQPYAVLLFDEIEKAHPEVFQILLQILEDGYVTDASGRRVQFTNTLILLTSNIGTSELNSQAELGFRLESESEQAEIQRHQQQKQELRDRLKNEVKDFLSPELYNRLDQLVVFDELSKSAVKKIARLQLGELAARLLHTSGVIAKFDASVVQWLLQKGFDPRYGARPMRRAIQEHVEAAMADSLLHHRPQKGEFLHVGVKSDRITISRASRSRSRKQSSHSQKPARARRSRVHASTR